MKNKREFLVNYCICFCYVAPNSAKLVIQTYMEAQSTHTVYYYMY
jgi:hypothetical protein